MDAKAAVAEYKRVKAVIDAESEQIQELVDSIPSNFEKAGKLLTELSPVSVCYLQLLIGKPMMDALNKVRPSSKPRTRYEIRRKRAELQQQMKEMEQIERGVAQKLKELQAAERDI